MCIIISKPPGTSLDRDVYEECFKFNKDGAGFAYVENNELKIDKGHFNFDALYDAIKSKEAGHVIAHFRIATHGEIGLSNCHPFMVKSEHRPHISFAIAHNGVLNWRSTKEESDTACFVKDMLGPVLSRDPWFLDHPQGILMLEKTIGSNNKLSILRHDSESKETKVYIVNESDGTKDLGCWFSNWTYKRYTPPTKVYADNIGDCGMYGYALTDGVWRPRARPDWPAVKQGSIVMRKPSVKNVTPTEDKDRKILDEAKVVVLEGGIHVPRDNGLRVDLSHLTKSQRKLLRKIAMDYVKAHGVDPKESSLYEMITWLREDVRAIHDGFKNVPEETIDRWILAERDKHSNHQTFIDQMENI